MDEVIVYGVAIVLFLGIAAGGAFSDELQGLWRGRAKRKAPRRALAGCKCERCEAHRKAFGDWRDSGRVEVSRPTQEAR